MLAEMGAEVIHIESPMRIDLVRIIPSYANGHATAHSYLNRNQQSIAMDLKDQKNIERIKEQIKDFDISMTDRRMTLK